MFINLEKDKKSVKIIFEHKFSWTIVELFRKYNIEWDAKRKVRHLTFNAATLPLSADKFVSDYQDIFDLYDASIVDDFKINFSIIIKDFEKSPKKEIQYDLSKYNNLDDYQKVGVQFLLNRGSAILADEMGVGKTRQTAVYTLEKKPKKVLVITPLSIRYVWREEFKNLGEKTNDFCIVEKEVENKKFVIINYDKLKKFVGVLEKIKWDVIILDEAHFLKSKDSQRFKFTYRISKKCNNIVCITGTPIMNRPAELFPLLKLVKHPLGQNFTQFANRYCDRKLVAFGPRSHWDISGANNLIELGEKLKDIMIRRLKKDCFNIPEKIYDVFKIPLPKAFRKTYDKVLNDYKTFCKNNPFLNKNSMQNHLTKINELRQICSIAKCDVTASLINDAIDNGEKVLVFGYYKETLNKLNKLYPNSLMITGDVRKDNEREEIVHKFQNNPFYKVFIGQIKAAGFGLTLTAGTVVIFNDLDWTPAAHSQSEDRSNRRGAIKETHIFYPIFEDTIEEDIQKILERKEVLIDQILEQTVDHYKEESVNKQLINMFYDKFK